MPPDAPWWLLAAAPAWLAAVAGASAWSRQLRGHPLRPRPKTDARFVERRASGRALDQPWQRLGGARNCLTIWVTDAEVGVCPSFPFTLGFLPELYGLDRQVPAPAITAVERHRGLAGQRVVIRFRTDRPHGLELRVRHPDRLLAALEALRR